MRHSARQLLRQPQCQNEPTMVLSNLIQTAVAHKRPARHAKPRTIDVCPEKSPDISAARALVAGEPGGAANLRNEIVCMIPALRAFARTLTRNAVDADDLLQESLVKALAHLAQFVPGTNLKAWLFTIERNTFYTQYNKRRRESLSVLEEADGVIAEPGQDWSMRVKVIDEALRQLPAQQRDALMLVGGAGLSYQEAAEVCECAVGTIKSRVNRGRLRLLELLEVDQETGSHETAHYLF